MYTALLASNCPLRSRSSELGVDGEQSRGLCVATAVSTSRTWTVSLCVARLVAPKAVPGPPVVFVLALHLAFLFSGLLPPPPPLCDLLYWDLLDDYLSLSNDRVN
ncbi:hypothetical protein PI125_g14859 [Phytophthora idaei]|nr:hypothetical protein PI125_g14859 [Phytophthora idaei]